jgi:hypothetical protein
VSWSSAIGGFLNALFGSAAAAAAAAKTTGVPALDIGATKISITSLIGELETLAKVDWQGALTSLDFSNAKQFLLSQGFASDVVDLSDILGLVGLAVPVVAVIANDVRTLAMVIAVVQKIPALVSVLNSLFGVRPEVATGTNPTYDALFPSANSPDDKTNNGWPTAIQP